MFLLKICRKLNTSCSRTCLTETSKEIRPTSKWKYKLDDTVENDLKENIFTPKHHPGISKPRTITLPKDFLKAVINTLEDQEHPMDQIANDSEKFVRFLQKRKAPMEKRELEVKISDLRQKIIERINKKSPDTSVDPMLIKGELINEMKKNVYNWYPINYDVYNGLLYLIGRSAGEYAALSKILSEIKTRDSQWKPKSLFDFGSGVGTVTWATKALWPNEINEFFNVDASADMNELAEHMLKGGRGEKQISLRGVYYRQFLPAKSIPYDLVVSAYSLMELPSLESRLKTIKTLWSKSSKYLVVVEQGTNEGFKLVNEVRDFVLGLGNSHVFGPCPQDDTCPRYLLNDGTPCNFEVAYFDLPVSKNSQLRKERFSYVVLRKGDRSEDDPQWPRLVRQTMLRHKHCICNLCTNEGKIEQAVFTASKYGKPTYRCAKASDWGDLLPVNIKTTYSDHEEVDAVDTNFSKDTDSCKVE